MAIIGLKGTFLRCTTDLSGRFHLDSIPQGDHEVEIKFVGYDTQVKKVFIKSKDSLTLNFFLNPSREIQGGPIIQFQEPLVEPKSGGSPVPREEFLKGRVWGTVLYAFSNIPIPGATISIKGTNLKTVSGKEGNFNFDSVIAPGEYFFYVTKPGMYPVSKQVSFKTYLNTVFYMTSSPFLDSATYFQIHNKLRELRKDTILLQYLGSNDCIPRDSSVFYYETGNIRHLKKTGEWIGYWGKGDICYQTNYRQKLKLKKGFVSKIIKGKNGKYDKRIYKEKFGLRYWVIPTDSLTAYNFNGAKAYTVHFTRKGFIKDSVIFIYDSAGKIRAKSNIRTGNYEEYCGHGIILSWPPIRTKEDVTPEYQKWSAHMGDCTMNCLYRLDFIWPVEPFGEGINPMRSKF